MLVLYGLFMVYIIGESKVDDRNTAESANANSDASPIGTLEEAVSHTLSPRGSCTHRVTVNTTHRFLAWKYSLGGESNTVEFGLTYEPSGGKPDETQVIIPFGVVTARAVAPVLETIPVCTSYHLCLINYHITPYLQPCSQTTKTSSKPYASTSIPRIFYYMN